ncbi:MAG: TRAP transporter TatT component family protein [Desulfobacteraceae bacterium]
MTSLMHDGMQVFEQDNDLVMLKQAMPAHIKLAEAMLSHSPKNRDLRILLARLYGSYAFAFEETDMEAIRYNGKNKTSLAYRQLSTEEIKQTLDQHFIKGAKYAKSVLILKYPNADKFLVNITQREQFLSILTPNDIPALFWYGFNLGGYVSHNFDSVRALSMASQVEAVMQRVIDLSPDYYYGTAHLILMLSQAIRPPMMGGNLKMALDHYNELKSIAGENYLLADVLYARYCLPQRQDHKSFEEILKKAAATKVEDSTSLALFNQIAVRRARIYLNATDQFFTK